LPEEAMSKSFGHQAVDQSLQCDASNAILVVATKRPSEVRQWHM